MKLDLETLVKENIHLKNEIFPIIKALNRGYANLQRNYEKFESPLLKIIEALEKYGKIEIGSPVYSLAKNYVALYEGYKKIKNGLKDNFLVTLEKIVEKSNSLNEIYKDLNSSIKDFKKINKKMKKVETQIAKLEGSEDKFKYAEKLAEKRKLDPEYNFTKDKLNESHERFHRIFVYYEEERDQLLKKAFSDLATMQKLLYNILKNYYTKLIEVANKLNIKI